MDQRPQPKVPLGPESVRGESGKKYFNPEALGRPSERDTGSMGIKSNN